jgi:hypothetical protein
MQKNKQQKTFNESQFTRNMLSKIRLYEAEEVGTPQENSSEDAVVIPESDPYFNDLKNNLIKFVGGVNLGSDSLVVYPKDNDVIFNGSITSLNGLKFQFRYNDQSGGLYIWSDSVLLNKDTIDKLNKLVTLKEQFSTYWDENISNYKK